MVECGPSQTWMALEDKRSLRKVACELNQTYMVGVDIWLGSTWIPCKVRVDINSVHGRMRTWSLHYVVCGLGVYAMLYMDMESTQCRTWTRGLHSTYSWVRTMLSGRSYADSGWIQVCQGELALYIWLCADHIEHGRLYASSVGVEVDQHSTLCQIWPS